MLCQVEDGIEMQVVENWSFAPVEIDGSARKIDKKQAPAGKLPLTEPEKNGIRDSRFCDLDCGKEKSRCSAHLKLEMCHPGESS